MVDNIPYSIEAEEAVIGSVLIHPALFLEIAVELKHDDFYLVRHRSIWRAMERLTGEEIVLDYLTVAEQMEKENTLDEAGGRAYLLQLINSVPTSTHATVYGEIVRRASLRRRMMVAADKIRALAMDEKKKYDDVYMEAQSILDELQLQDAKQQHVRGMEADEYYADTLCELMLARSQGKLTALPLPESWFKFREKMPALFISQMVVISGGTGSGKSVVLETLGEHYATMAKVEYIHTEMSTADVLHRRMARHSGVPFVNLASGDISPDEDEAIERARKRINQWGENMTYRWMPDVPFRKLALQMRLSAERGTQVFLLDHFQDITIGSGANENPVRMFERACQWLAKFTEKYGVVLIVASQENDAGKVKWSRKLVEKATGHISIRRKRLKADLEYYLDGVRYLYEAGDYSPFAEVRIEKARFARSGSMVKMVMHGAGFQFLDMSRIRRATPHLMANPRLIAENIESDHMEEQS